MHEEETGNPNMAVKLFLQAWHEATDDLEKFLAAWYVALHQPDEAEQLAWYETALKLAMNLNNDAVKAALPSLHEKMAHCYEVLGDRDHEKKHRKLAHAVVIQPSDNGPFYHGTRADLKIGDELTAGRLSNYHSELIMNHIYFTALTGGAGLAAALSKGDGRERVYIVRPTGLFEDDPNVTNKKFPGNPTRSYRTQQPLSIIGEITEWQRQTPEQLQLWRERLASNKGEIIN
nr:NAD(+)--rifampin ADP-ribosyltransferase [Mucilaginibacter rigui]